jgi:mRNA interferase RelE/StbE
VYHIREDRKALKSLTRMQPEWAARIRSKIAEIAVNPYAHHVNVTKLQGREGYRLRVGDWRVLYVLKDDELVLLVVDVVPRGSAYSH